jgi:hypothetical protein
MSDATICQSCGRDLNEWYAETGKWRCFYCAKEWHTWIETKEQSWAAEPHRAALPNGEHHSG